MINRATILRKLKGFLFIYLYLNLIRANLQRTQAEPTTHKPNYRMQISNERKKPKFIKLECDATRLKDKKRISNGPQPSVTDVGHSKRNNEIMVVIVRPLVLAAKRQIILLASVETLYLIYLPHRMIERARRAAAAAAVAAAAAAVVVAHWYVDVLQCSAYISCRACIIISAASKRRQRVRRRRRQQRAAVIT